MQSSNRLNVADYYHINNEISDTSSFQDITKKILSPLAQLVGGETSLFVTLKKTDNGMRAYNLIRSSIDYEASLSYVENFQSSDPALPYVFNAAKVNYKRGISKSISVALENIIDFKKFSRGKYYNEFLRPNSLRHLMVVGIPSVTDNSLVYALGFHRYSNNAFKKADARISSYFGPMLSNALHNLELKTQLSDHNIIVSYLKKQIYNMGLVILDNNLEVIFASSAGQKHLQINHDSGNHYPSLDSSLLTVLRFHTKPVAKPPTKEIEFEYKGVKIVAQTSISDRKIQGNRVVLNTYCLSHANTNPIELEQFKLTQRELDISRLIVIGMTSPQVSKKLSISIRTVENHLRSIYAKAGVKNRTSLAYKLAPLHIK